MPSVTEPPLRIRGGTAMERWSALDQFFDPSDRGAAENHLEQDARRGHNQGCEDHQEVFEQDAQREQHDTKRRQRVEAREGRGDERGHGSSDHEQAKDDVAQAVVEQKAQAGPREALEPADRLHQRRDEALLLVPGQLQSPPALRQPDLLAPDDQLECEQHRDDLEHVRGTAGRERQRRHPEQDHKKDREALLLEQLDQASQCLLAVACEPALQLVADLCGSRASPVFGGAWQAQGYGAASTTTTELSPRGRSAVWKPGASRRSTRSISPRNSSASSRKPMRGVR